MKVFVFCLLFSTIGVNAKNTSEISDNYIKVTYEDFLKNQFLHDCKGQNNRETITRYYEYELLSGTTVYYSLTFVNGSNMIFTPNGSDSIYTIQYLNDLPDEVKIDINTRNSNKYGSSITMLSSATTIFNCHSYAWYMQSVSQNEYWLSYPYQYIFDYSYLSSTPEVNDILVYVTRRTYPDNSYDEYISHSAIIQSIENGFSISDTSTLDKIQVISKWGQSGLYIHNGDDCPYVETVYAYENDIYLYTEALVGLISYHPRTNYSFTLTSSFNNTIPSYPNGSGLITEKYAMYELNASNGYYDFSVSSGYSLDVRLYDEHMQLVSINQTITGTYTNSFTKYLSSGRYYLRVAYQNTSQSGTIYTSISYHSHSYDDHYVWKNTTEHKSYCACGSYITDFHIVSPDAFQNGNLFAICLLCNGRAIFGGIIHDGMGGYPYTLNGSFILPNGVIVLDEDDMEAYLNGTVVFIDSNNNADRDNNHIEYYYKKENTNEKVNNHVPITLY